MFKMPALCSYPKLPTIGGRPELNGMPCYVIARYDPGQAILIKRESGNIGIQVGDWSGNISDRGSQIAAIKDITTILAEVMCTIRLPQAQFYLSKDGKLVDVQVSLNKFLGPGMLRDLFSKVIPTQQIIEIAALTAEKIASIKGKGDPVIIKPVRYRFVEKRGLFIPLYAFI